MGGGPCQYDTAYLRKVLGGQKSGGMYCSLHNKKYGQRGISLSPKMGRGVAAPPREAEHNICS